MTNVQYIRICAGVGIVGLFGMLALILQSGALSYDEPWYLSTVQLVESFGLTSEFLRSLPGPAGSLYSVVHYVLQPFTGLTLPGVRLVSLVFLLASVFILGRAMTARGEKHGFAKALTVLGIPVLFVVGGMALTDVISIFFYLVHVFFFLQLLDENERSRELAYAVFSGFAFGLCIIGRQSYLITLLAFVPLFLSLPNKRVSFLVCLLSSLWLPLVHFYVWQGLIPPLTPKIIPPGIDVLYIGIAFGYAGVVQLLFNPRYLIEKWRKFLVAAIVITVGFYGAYLIGWLGGDVTAFGESIVRKVLPEEFLRLYGAAAFGGLMAVALVFAKYLIVNLWRCYKTDPAKAFLWMSILCLLIAPGRMGRIFSFRYVLAPCVLLVLLEIGDQSFTKWKVARLGLGVTVGLMMLSSYLWN